MNGPATYLTGGWAGALFAAGLLHLAGAAVLAYLPAAPNDTETNLLLLRLPLPAEQPLPMIIVSAEPEDDEPPQPEPPPGQPEPETPPAPNYSDEILRELAEEREHLREELARARADIASLPPPPAPETPPPTTGPPGRGSLGTIRELDFSDSPDHITKQVMARYRMRVTIKEVPGGSNQSFLSSASAPTGERFYANRNSPPGIYQVFELSRASVAKMSQLEEAEIRLRGLRPELANVKHVKFGITQTPEGPDLAVKSIDMESLAP